MLKQSLVSLPRVILIFSFLVLTACGGGGNQSASSQEDSEIVISGAGIKGPLAFANVELYALDTRFPELYEPGNPIAEATTNAYAEISGLSVSRDIPPPYVLVIDGTNAIDRNTGVAPVISKLVTIITRESLAAGKPVYATPYTTLAYQMLKLEPTPTASGTGGFVESNTLQHLITIEAEHYAANLPQQGQEWERVLEPGFSGEAAMRATGSGMAAEQNYSNANPQLNFPVVIGTPGKYYVWLRVIGAASNANSLHVGLDNRQIATGEDVQFQENAAWSWQGGSGAASIDIGSAGAHTLNLWMRESGVIVDKVILTTDPWYTPTEQGPDESDRGAGSSSRQLFPSLVDTLDGFNTKIIQSISFGMPLAASIFSTPPIITEATASIETQKLVVHHRAAIEAFSSMLHEMHVASPDVTSDELIRSLALDLYSDGAIDGKSGNQLIEGINLRILSQDPMQLEIANTAYTVAQIVALMDEESAIVGSGSNTHFYKDELVVALEPFASGSTAYQESANVQQSIVDYSNTISNTTVSTNKGGVVLKANFDNRPLGLYEDAALREDFKVGDQGYNDTVHGPDWNSTFIVNDPAGNTGRGRVMEVTRTAGRPGSSAESGGMRFRADLPPSEEYYFAYDMFVPSVDVGGYDYWFPLQQKQPSLINGTLLDASHATGEAPEIDGITGFNSRTQFYGHDYLGRGEGSAATKPIDAAEYKPEYFWDIVNPTKNDVENTFNHPRGRWITVEQRVKMNTADNNNAYDPSVDKPNGILEIWVTDVAIGWYGKKVKEKRDFIWRYVNTMKIDGIHMYDHYGGSWSDDRNKPPQNQSKYYDNFIVSTSPITH